jgi:hypothetical protein
MCKAQNWNRLLERFEHICMYIIRVFMYTVQYLRVSCHMSIKSEFDAFLEKTHEILGYVVQLMTTKKFFRQIIGRPCGKSSRSGLRNARHRTTTGGYGCGSDLRHPGRNLT